MTTASVTSYALTSTAPKDSGGAKILPLIRADASVATFTLLKGIGTSQNDAGFMFSHMAVGVHSQGSAIEDKHPFVTIGGVYLDDYADASRNTIDSGQGKIAGISKAGEMFSAGASRTLSMVTTSVNTLATSMLIYGVIVAGDGVTAGDTVVFGEGDNARFTHVFTNANETKFIGPFDGPLYFSALEVDRTISGGAASISLIIPAGIS